MSTSELPSPISDGFQEIVLKPSLEPQEEKQSDEDVSALKSEIQRLKQLLQTQDDKFQSERQDLVEKLEFKTKTVDTLRVRTNRYEFAMKEAILFLHKPLSIYESVMNNFQSPNAKHAPARKTSAKSIEILDTKTASKTGVQGNQVPVKTFIQSNTSQIDLLSNSALEVQCLECIKLAHTYMNSAMDIIRKTGPNEECQLPQLPRDEKRDAVFRVDEESDTGFDAKSPSTPVSASINTHRRARSESVAEQNANRIIQRLQLDIERGGQNAIVDSAIRSAPAQQEKLECMECRENIAKLSNQQEMIDSLKQDITSLVLALQEERERKEKLQIAKDILDKELDELTEQLFEQANKMVSDESKLRDQLETANKDLSGQLKNTLRKFEDREREMEVLRNKLRQLDKLCRSQEGVNLLTSKPASLSLQSLIQLSSQLNASTPESEQKIEIDAFALQEFQEHIKETMTNNHINVVFAHSTAYMKRCLTEDVEPCLFALSANYVNNSKPSTASGIRKRLLDAVPKAHYEFQDMKPHQKTKCNLCQTVRDCGNQMRTFTVNNAGITSFNDWITLCGFCKERVEVVGGFYKYLAGLKQQAAGKQGASLLGMFRHSTWLRRKMAVARVGCTQLFEGEMMGNAMVVNPSTPVIVGSSTNYSSSSGEWERWVSIVS